MISEQVVQIIKFYNNIFRHTEWLEFVCMCYPMYTTLYVCMC